MSLRLGSPQPRPTAIPLAPRARDVVPEAFERDGQLFMPVDPTLTRKACAQPSPTVMKAAGSDLRTGRGVVITTEHIDRDGDILRSSGADGGIDWTHYRASNPIVLLQHGRNLVAFPVIGGNAVLSRTTVDGYPGWQADEFLFADTELARDIAGMWRDTILRTASVGVMPSVFYPIDRRGIRLDPQNSEAMAEQAGFEVAKSEGREWSIVAIPANPWARQKMGDLTVRKAAAYFDLGAPAAKAVPAVDAPPFDPGEAALRAGSTEVEWAAAYLGVPVSGLIYTDTTLPPVRLGSFYYSLDQVVAGLSLVVQATRNIVGENVELPPRFERVALGPERHASMLVHGVQFLRSSRPEFVIARERLWYGWNEVRVYARAESAHAAEDVLTRAWTLARGSNNFLRGEAFSLGGEFLPKTAETWGSAFLTDDNSQVMGQLERHIARGDSRGVLMTGPPGTGKTLSGRILRNSSAATFVWMSSRDFDRYSAFGAIERAFDLARELNPCVLFFEDVDSWIGGAEVDLLKTEMDGARSLQGTTTILTSNYPERLPAALIDRPGRFHDVLVFALPDAAIRARMLTAWLPSLVGEEQADAVEKTVGFSGAHLREFTRYAQSLADEDGVPLVEAIDKALAKMRAHRAIITPQVASDGYRMRAADETVLKAEAVTPARPCAEPVRVDLEPAVLSVDLLGRALKDGSLERCPRCRDVVPYARAAGRFVSHRTAAGPLCPEQMLVGVPTGPTLKTMAALFRDAVQEPALDALPAQAGGLGVLLLAAADLRATNTRAGLAVREIGTCIKDGRVLSAETRALLAGVITQVEESVDAASDTHDAIREAAGALKRFLVAVDRREDNKSSTEAVPRALSPSDALEAALRDPVVAAALAQVAALHP